MKDHTTQSTDARSENQFVRRTFLLALIPAVLLAAKMAESAEVTVAGTDGQPWTIEIEPVKQPLELALLATPQVNEAPAFEEPAEVALLDDAAVEVEIVPNRKYMVNGLTYEQIYNSIPYSRTEYLANPSYRHEATMELLTGVPRQTVIHRTYEPKLNVPIEPQPQFLYNRYGTFGGTFGGGYGPAIGFGYGFYRPQYAPAFRYFLPLEYGL